MIRFLLPVLLLAFGSCQVPNQGNDVNASQASLEVSEDCSGGDCSSQAAATAAAASECTEGQSECCSEKAAAATAAAASQESCAMKAAGVCEEGGECPMQAAGNAECAEMGSEECPMEKAKAEAAVQASLVIGEGCCEGKTVAEACGGCADKATAASMEHCEGKEGDCSMAAVAASQEACAMKAAGVCEEGGECPMQAAGNVECAEMGSEECPMEKAKAEAAAIQASLIVGEGCCEGKAVAEACGGCADKATAASMDKCEGMDPAECEAKKAECEAKSECSSEEAPASVETGATQAGAVKEEASSCCSSKVAEPSN